MATEKAILTVEGMRCNHCKMAVEKALKAVQGVNEVNVDLAAKNVTVTYETDATNLEILSRTISEEGYQVVK